MYFHNQHKKYAEGLHKGKFRDFTLPSDNAEERAKISVLQGQINTIDLTMAELNSVHTVCGTTFRDQLTRLWDEVYVLRQFDAYQDNYEETGGCADALHHTVTMV